MLSLLQIRPPGRGLRIYALLALLFLTALSLSAQRPQYSKWNLGASIGIGPLNANTGLPSLTARYRRWGAELAPYPFAQGIGLVHHSPVLPFLKKVQFSVDAMAFFNRQNGNYYLTFPSTQRMHNTLSTGLMVGPSVYFLKRCSAQLLLGVQLLNEYGPEEQRYSAKPFHYFLEAAALSLHVNLFQNFDQQ